MRTVYDQIHVRPSVGISAHSGTTGSTGGIVDTKGNYSAMLVAIAGAANGSPTSSSLAAVLQESSDNVTYATAVDNTGAAIQAVVVNTSAQGMSFARIEGLMQNRKRYLRVVTTPAFVGGTSPSFTAAALIVMDRQRNLPAHDETVSNT